MYLSPDTLSFTADESAALKIAIVMTDANGIDIVSARDIVFAAENDIKITGKTITLEVGAAASGAASGATTPGLYLNTGLASIVMKDDVNNFYGKPVKMEGTNKAPCPQPEEVPVEEAEADEENKMTGEDWAELGLAVAGFIPGLGTAAAIGEAGLAAAKGDYLGAGISLLGAIPVFGGLMKVGRSFKAVSKLGSKLSKVLNAGKKVIGKAKKAVKAASAALGRMLTRAVKSIGDQMKMIKDAAERVAKKRPRKAQLKYHSDGSIRDSKGRFAGKTGMAPGTPGVEKAITKIKTDPAYKGYDVLGNEISVKSADGTLRRYDVVCRKPDGTIVGVEVKSGMATRTPQQRRIDDELMKNGGLSTTGKKARDIRVKKIDTVEVIHVD